MAFRGLSVVGALALTGIAALPLPAQSGSVVEASQGSEFVDSFGLGAAALPAGSFLFSYSNTSPGRMGPGLGLGRGAGGGTVLAHRPWRTTAPGTTKQDSYVLLKGGGMYVNEESEAEGVFAGLELGGTVEEVLDIGFSVDYFYRGTIQTDLVSETDVDGLPVRLVSTVDESSAHLVPVGVTMRLHLPLFGARFMPFVAGTFSYESLFLRNFGDPNSTDPVKRILAQDQTFNGFGWQGAAGMDLKFSPALALFGEVGLHHGSPSQQIRLNGSDVDLNVDMDGPFLSGGLRFGM